MSITRHPGTIGFGSRNRYPGSIRVLREMLAAETNPAERKVLEARIAERQAHRSAQRRRKRARLEAEASHE